MSPLIKRTELIGWIFWIATSGLLFVVGSNRWHFSKTHWFLIIVLLLGIAGAFLFDRLGVLTPPAKPLKGDIE